MCIRMYSYVTRMYPFVPVSRIKKWSIARSQIPHHKSLLLFMALRDLSRGAPTMSMIIGKLSAWQISDVTGEESG